MILIRSEEDRIYTDLSLPDYLVKIEIMIFKDLRLNHRISMCRLIFFLKCTKMGCFTSNNKL